MVRDGVRGQADPDSKWPHSQCSATQRHMDVLEDWWRRVKSTWDFEGNTDYSVKNALGDG